LDHGVAARNLQKLRSLVGGFKKGSGTVVRSTLRAVPATVPDPFLSHADFSPSLQEKSQVVK